MTEQDERNAWLALKCTANRLVRELEALTHTAETLQENITTLEQVQAERAKVPLADKTLRRGLYENRGSDGN